MLLKVDEPSFQWPPTCCPCSCHRCPAHSCRARCLPAIRVFQRLFQHGETMGHPMYGPMVAIFIRKRWSKAISWNFWAYYFFENTPFLWLTWPVTRAQELRETYVKRQKLKWAHFHSKSMMQYMSHCLCHYHKTCLVLPLCERVVPYEIQLRTSESSLLWGRSGAEWSHWNHRLTPIPLVHMGVHAICAGQGCPLLSRKFTSPASVSGSLIITPRKTCQPNTPFLKTGISETSCLEFRV